MNKVFKNNLFAGFYSDDTNIFSKEPAESTKEALAFLELFWMPESTWNSANVGLLAAKLSYSDISTQKKDSVSTLTRYKLLDTL